MDGLTTSSCFDQLVCLRILQFTHHSDWSSTQPFLISKTFNNVFNSNGFTNDFLKRIFHLDQLDELEKVIKIMKEECKEKILQKKQTEGKRRKKNDKTTNSSFSGITLPQNLRDVLKIYVKCSVYGDETIIKDRVVQCMEKFTKTKDVALLDSVTDLVKNLKIGLDIHNSYQKLVEEGEDSVYFYIGSQSHEIASELLPKLFRKLKGVFVLSKEEQILSETQTFKNTVIVFTNCGYPLLIETEYLEKVDSYRSNNHLDEKVSIYSHEVFNHTKISNQHGYFDTEFTCSTSDLLETVQNFIFSPDISNILKREFSSHPQQAIKEGLIYEFFQIAFGEKRSEFIRDCDEWVPFRNIDDAHEQDEETEEDHIFIDDSEVCEEEMEELKNSDFELLSKKRIRKDE